MATAPQIRAIYALGSKLGINQNNRKIIFISWFTV